MADFSMERELAECRKYAEGGYRFADAEYSKIEQTLNQVLNRIEAANSEQNRVSRLKNTDFMYKIKTDVDTLKQKIKLIRKDIDALRERQKDFSIVVFGRTMAGKSTLMEILTRGDGSSIGKGAQRTTRDVRSYYWSGLRIIDVPGIESFGGKADDKLAFEAAKSADLILFLLTDNAPSPEEGACLAQLKKLGKPIIGVINVKITFNINDELDVEDLEDCLADQNRIKIMLNQFREFSKLHNQDWSDIKWVATHLNAAYQAHPFRANNKKVYAISNFAQVENFILDKVRTDGKFLRTKNFIDSVAVPMNNIIMKIFEHSANSLKQSDIWFYKRVQFQKWSDSFVTRTRKRLDRLYDELKETLHREIDNFAENHYEDEKINEHWEACLKNLGFDKRYQSLLKDFANECEQKRRELSDQLTQELSYSFNGNMKTNIELEGTTPWGQYLSLASNLLVFVPGVGWGARIAIGVGSALFSFLFDDKAQKIREAKAKLRKDLSNPSFKMLYQMHKQVINIFDENIVAKGINEFSIMLSEYAHLFARLGKSQAELANSLRQDYESINSKLLDAAIRYKGKGSLGRYIVSIRIPGEIFTVFAENSTLLVKPISDLLGEKFFVMEPYGNLADARRQILGCDTSLSYCYDSKSSVVCIIVPQGKVNPTSLKLAQQLSEDPIILR